jgi:hypothetical protein
MYQFLCLTTLLLGTKVNPLEVWDAISHPNHPLTPLAQLACCILSICPNSASVEHLRSVFGTILTRLRTQLGNKALLDIAKLKLYLQEERTSTSKVSPDKAQEDFQHST